ncbi:hypothetical protein QBC47DRAFT_336060 [Echria macrotheca]|uniref:Uncharacterized protein n=1 Tax=Echria macrotheca TaxID=438768 RepID=A0AAJ0BNR6_9PEZI|nr:hypothetical protein QBC47DRAFT_336060 [Echria macrotheca]
MPASPPSTPPPGTLKLPAPPAPYPWIWRCHACRNIYRLSCTRRCLECNHTFCVISSSSSTSIPPEEESSSTSSSRRKRKERGGPCEAEFDYAGWAAWGSYRRRTHEPAGEDAFAMWAPRTEGEGEGGWMKVDAQEGEMVRRRKERLFVSRGHDCWVHCDYPSECRHSMYAAFMKGMIA